MIAPAIPTDEESRLNDLRSLRILDTPCEDRFDRFTRLASRTFNTPMAVVSLVDQNRQWFKSRHGVHVCGSDRSQSFCGHAILREEALIIPDSHEDDRFRDNPLVTGEPHVRFYAGHPLKGRDGFNIGTLCVMDSEPREFSETDEAALRDLASLVEAELNLVDHIETQHQLIESQKALIETRDAMSREIDQASLYIRSLIPSPLREPAYADWRFIPCSDLGGDVFAYRWIDENRLIMFVIDVTGHGISASLLAISVLNVILSKELDEIDYCLPDQVLRALNKSFPMSRQGNRLFSIWMGTYNRKYSRLCYSNAGHPYPLLKRSGAETFEPLGYSGTLIGMLPNFGYESRTVEINPGDHLLLFSDGIVEVGQQTYEDFIDTVNALPPSDSLLDPLIDHQRKVQGSDGFEDDVSLVEFKF